MIRKSNESDRRVFTFPAVQPSENISLLTLLTSLIALSQKISNHRSQFFASNKRNARKAITIIEGLQVFLEEIRDQEWSLPNSVILSFSELHLTYQKLQFLLEDCTLEGAQLWMLMESDRVATKCRVLSRSIATALDVFPLSSVPISVEVNEQVELLMKQARKARFELEPDDEQVMMVVFSVLNQFQNRITPTESDLKWILAHIGLRRWSECNKVLKFLDSEIGFECLNEEKRKMTFLGSLIGFMSYYRCVVYNVVDDEDYDPKSNRRESCSNIIDSEILGCLNPDDFRCPISLEFMTDPVTIETGHSYDRSSILKWFRSGSPTCPKTGKSLTSLELVPNLVLRRLIHQYCSENGVLIADPARDARRNWDISRTAQPRSLAPEEAMKMVANFLSYRLETGTMEERNKVAYEIRLLTKTSIFNRSCLVEAKAIPHFLQLFLSKDSSTQENAITALLNLSKHPKGRAIIVENWGLELIVGVLNKGLKIEARQHAAATLFYLASNEEFRRLIGEQPEAIPSLIKLIKDGSDRAKKNGLVAIFGLSMQPENHMRLLAAGAIPMLVKMLKSCDRQDLVTDSLAVLATLAARIDGTIEVLRCGALPLVVGVMSSLTSRMGKEYCVSLLLSLSINGGADVVAILGKSSSLMRSLYWILGEGTAQASKKASALIRVLQDFSEGRSSGFKPSVLPQEQVAHVW
ncbi:hypothetical protein L6164_012443 [Bauhinia variegata]|uniref:Uncharacterized protein n=1 Tax=Bauhinia variegata TaxID=167791 RepID=A0ACB9P9Z0_BAUVA|nr:hypothetical protein L6164_012443 [Bauhinia variegata]